MKDKLGFKIYDVLKKLDLDPKNSSDLNKEPKKIAFNSYVFVFKHSKG